MASSAGSDRDNEWENGDRTGGDMDACQIKDGDLLRMLARAYRSNFFNFTRWWGNFERQKPLNWTYNSLLVCRKEDGVRKTYLGYFFV